MKNKGFIIIYTLLLVSICFFIVITCFKVQNIRFCNNVAAKRYLLNTEIDKYKHILFKRFNDMIEEANPDNIREYLINKDDLSLSLEDYVLKYDKINDNFIFINFKNGKMHQNDIYEYMLVNKKIKFKCKKTIY